MADLRRLDLDAIRPKQNELVLYERTWRIPAEITIPVMAEFLALEQRIKTGGEGEAAEAVEAINEAHRQIELMLALDPGVEYDPEDGVFTVRETGEQIVVQLSVREILAIIAFLIGNDDGAVAEATEALEQAGTPKTPEGELASRTEVEEDEDGIPQPTPLASRKRSSKRSSGSRTRRGSLPAGGETATGETGSSAPATPSRA